MTQYTRSGINAQFDLTIKTNGNENITGPVLNAELKKISESYLNLLSDQKLLGFGLFDPSVTYRAGQTVWKDGKMYVSVSNGNQGAWNPENWDLKLDPGSIDGYLKTDGSSTMSGDVKFSSGKGLAFDTGYFKVVDGGLGFDFKGSSGFGFSIKSDALTVKRDFSLPDKSGTIALLSDLQTAGAGIDITSSVVALKASLKDDGNGNIYFKPQTVNPAAPVDGFVLFSNASGTLSWRRKNGTDSFIRTISSVLTADRTFSFVDASYTIAGKEIDNQFSVLQTLSQGAKSKTLSILDFDAVTYKTALDAGASTNYLRIGAGFGIIKMAVAQEWGGGVTIPTANNGQWTVGSGAAELNSISVRNILSANVTALVLRGNIGVNINTLSLSTFTYPIQLVTGDSTGVDPTHYTGNIYLKTGNITNASATSYTGNIYMFTGTNAGSGRKGTIALGIDQTTGIAYLTTAAGSQNIPTVFIDTVNSITATGGTGYIFDSTNGFGITRNNGTNRILRTWFTLVNNVDTSGLESSSLQLNFKNASDKFIVPYQANFKTLSILDADAVTYKTAFDSPVTNVLRLGNGFTTAYLPQNISLPDVSGTDVAGLSYTISSGNGRGIGGESYINFVTSSRGSNVSGTSSQTLSPVMSVGVIPATTAGNTGALWLGNYSPINSTNFTLSRSSSNISLNAPSTGGALLFRLGGTNNSVISISSAGTIISSYLATSLTTVFRGYGTGGSYTQSVDLTQWKSYDGTTESVLSKIDKDGKAYFPELNITNTLKFGALSNLITSNGTSFAPLAIRGYGAAGVYTQTEDLTQWFKFDGTTATIVAKVDKDGKGSFNNINVADPKDSNNIKEAVKGLNTGLTFSTLDLAGGFDTGKIKNVLFASSDPGTIANGTFCFFVDSGSLKVKNATGTVVTII